VAQSWVLSFPTMWVSNWEFSRLAKTAKIDGQRAEALMGPSQDAEWLARGKHLEQEV